MNKFLNTFPKIFIFLIVGLQILVIYSLLTRIDQKKSGQILGTFETNPMNKDYLIFPETSELKHFYEPKPNSVIVDNLPWMPYQPIYNINSDALNSENEYLLDKDSHVLRIVAMGDSHTFGSRVNTVDNYPSQLERLLNQQYTSCSNNYNKFEVINIGEGGYEIAYAIHRYFIRGAKYKPDLILWYIKADDFDEDTDVIFDALYDCDEKNPNYKSENATVEEWHYCWNQSRKYMYDKYSKSEIFDKNSKLLIEFVSRLNTKIIFFGYKDESKNVVNFLNSLTSKNNVYYFNDVKFTDLPRLPDYHPTVQGYKILVDILANYINENFLHCY